MRTWEWEYPDAEVKTMIDALPRASGADHPTLKAAIERRRSQVSAGLARAAIFRDFEEQLKRRVDPLLRLRWDEGRPCWFLDRLNLLERCWMPLLPWIGGDGRPRPLDQELIHFLRERDMWRWRGPASYLRHKREEAEKIRVQNQRQADDKVLEAVDSLSSRQISEFIAVQNAIRSGEKIIAHGADEKFLGRALRVP